MDVTIKIDKIEVFAHVYENGPNTETLKQLLKEVIMPSVQEIKDAIAAEAQEVATRVSALEAEVQALKDQIANGGTVSEQDLQDILDGVKGIFNPPTPQPGE